MSPEAIAELLAFLAQTPATIVSLVENLSEADCRLKQTPEEFSVIENICHLRDIEAEGYAVRIKRILTEDQPSLPDIDGARLAVERNYNKQNIDDALQSFAQARSQNLKSLGRLDSSELTREGKLEGVGSVTLARLLMMMRDHDEGHIADIRSALRLPSADSAD